MKTREDLINFYEGKFVKSKFYLPPNSLPIRLGLILSIYSAQRKFEIHVENSESLLDLGCGGGWELLRRKSKKVIGVDISTASLKVAKKLYFDCVRADIRNLPFRDKSFDYVVSSDVLGHVPNLSKDKAISEMFRVLKENGKTFHCIETDGLGPLPRWAKKFSRPYLKCFIELDGHHGLEKPCRAIKRFRSKFKIIKIEKVYSGLLWPVTEYIKRFDEEFQKKSIFIKLLVKLSNEIIKNFYLHALVNCILGFLSKLFDIITPFDWADGIYILCKK